MLCKSCGRFVSDGAEKCSYCGCAVAVEPMPKINTHLTEAILVTLFCSLPFGIPAIVHAAMTAAFISRGDVELARRSSRRAFMWVKIAGWVGAGVIIIATLLVLMLYRRWRG